MDYLIKGAVKVKVLCMSQLFYYVHAILSVLSK